jgi:NhaP-type Na+/H+ or K+/H+ antiporter/mannitol/fructose-specific phosphotransferase system IIA component (Ntr-type)
VEDPTLTLAVSAAAGTVLIVTADRLRVPSIVLLLLGGVLLGPEVAGFVHPASLGHGLETVIGLAVAVILFEGGLTLSISGYRRAPRVIQRMLTVGVLITWLGVAITVHLVLGWSPPLALLAGSLVIVTGPTVISPILRRVRVTERLHHVLYWEGVMIDAIGVFVAVLCFEWLSSPDDGVIAPVASFLLRFLVGAALGLVAGVIIAVTLARRWVADEHANIFALSLVVLGFGSANALMDESGLLAVVTAGLVVAVTRPVQLSKMKTFKLELTELAIGVLFILLSAKLDLSRFSELGLDLVIIVGVVLFVIRPLNIFASTLGQGFRRNEKLFLSWLAPRGIVAASMASLFSLRLAELGNPNAVHLETITYAVIGTTVALQGLSAPMVARALGVCEVPHRTWLVLGQRSLGQALVRGLRRAGIHAVTIGDRLQGVSSDESSLISVDDVAQSDDDPRLADVDQVLLVHSAARDRQLAARVWAQRVGRSRCYSWTIPGQPDADTEETPAQPTFTTCPAPAEVAVSLENNELAVEVLQTTANVEEPGRFGRDIRPLFWIRADTAELVSDPTSPGPPTGELAVVLKRRIKGLAGLVADVTFLTTPRPTMRGAVLRLLEEVAHDYPTLPVDGILDGILGREATMSTAIGGGVAVPHAYWDGVAQPRSYLALVPEGLDVAGPDGEPVRLVALLVSPPDQAKGHLRALGALVDVLSDEHFRDLLLRQRMPARVARLLAERA